MIKSTNIPSEHWSTHLGCFLKSTLEHNSILTLILRNLGLDVITHLFSNLTLVGDISKIKMMSNILSCSCFFCCVLVTDMFGSSCKNLLQIRWQKMLLDWQKNHSLFFIKRKKRWKKVVRDEYFQILKLI